MPQRYAIHAAWDAEAGCWCGHNDELPLTTEAATLDELLTRVLVIAPEIAVENGLVVIGDEIEIQLVAKGTVLVAV